MAKADEGASDEARSTVKRWGVIRRSKRVHFFDPPGTYASNPPDRWESRCSRWLTRDTPPLPLKRMASCYSCILRTNPEEQTMPHFASVQPAAGPSSPSLLDPGEQK